MRSIFRFVITIILSVALLGCSTFVPHSQNVQISTSETDAKLYVNGREVDNPAQLRAKRKSPLTISTHKPGYHVETRKVKPILSGTGIADLIGLVLIILPGIGLLTPGAWELEETDIHIQMFKSDEPATSIRVKEPNS